MIGNAPFPTANRLIIISGCSGGGKSSLLAELSRRGYRVVEEPGRRIVQQELAGNGAALPWVDIAAFARRAAAMSLSDRASIATADEWVFFDRGLVDAAAALEHATGEPAVTACRAHPYYARMFMAPPWPEIYGTDPERRHDIDAALAEYDRLLHAYASLGYEILTLPRISVEARADHVLNMLEN